MRRRPPEILRLEVNTLSLKQAITTGTTAWTCCGCVVTTRYAERVDVAVSVVLYCDRDITSYDRLAIWAPTLIRTPISHLRPDHLVHIFIMWLHA